MNCKRGEGKGQGQGQGEGEGVTETDLVPILIRELVAWVSPLDASAGNEDIGLQSLVGYCGNNFLDRFTIGQLRNMDVGLATEAVDDFISSAGIRLIALDKNDIGTGLGQSKGHGLTDATSAAGDEGSAPAQGE